MTDAAPPESLEDELVSRLRESSKSELRDIIHFAQTLLRHRSTPTEAIKPREGEEILNVYDDDTPTVVIVYRRDSPDEGPVAYRVHYQPSIEGEDGGYKWHYLGRVADALED